MVARIVTTLLRDPASARTLHEGRRAGGRVQVVASLRHLSMAILLLAFSAFVLQPLAHASPRGHSAHQGADVATEPCAHSPVYASADGVGSSEAPVKHCNSGEGSGQTDCCQACVAAAILPAAQPLSLRMNRDSPSRMAPNHLGRTPSGILRPPRPIVSA